MSNSFQHERRAAQRFPFHVPIAIRMGEDEKTEVGFTQDIGARGAFFYTVGAVAEGSRLQVSFTMPSTITLTEDMRILCTGEAVRIERLADGIRMGVAVRLRDYEFLPTADTDASFDRIHSLHGRRTGAEDSSL
jgi:PilZ domain-containing protein